MRISYNFNKSNPVVKAEDGTTARRQLIGGSLPVQASIPLVGQPDSRKFYNTMIALRDAAQDAEAGDAASNLGANPYTQQADNTYIQKPQAVERQKIERQPYQPSFTVLNQGHQQNAIEQARSNQYQQQYAEQKQKQKEAEVGEKLLGTALTVIDPATYLSAAGAAGQALLDKGSSFNQNYSELYPYMAAATMFTTPQGFLKGVVKKGTKSFLRKAVTSKLPGLYSKINRFGTYAPGLVYTGLGTIGGGLVGATAGSYIGTKLAQGVAQLSDNVRNNGRYNEDLSSYNVGIFPPLIGAGLGGAIGGIPGFVLSLLTYPLVRTAPVIAGRYIKHNGFKGFGSAANKKFLSRYMSDVNYNTGDNILDILANRGELQDAIRNGEYIYDKQSLLSNARRIKAQLEKGRDYTADKYKEWTGVDIPRSDIKLVDWSKAGRSSAWYNNDTKTIYSIPTIDSNSNIARGNNNALWTGAHEGTHAAEDALTDYTIYDPSTDEYSAIQRLRVFSP